VARDVAMSVVLDYFNTLFYDRFNQARNLQFQGRKVNGGVALVRYAEISEDEIYGKRTASLLVSYQFTCDLDQVLPASGLFRPVPGTNGQSVQDWQSWATSLLNTAENSRGNAKLKFTKDQDIIINLCKQSALPINGFSQIPQSGQYQTQTSFVNPIPDADSSWLDLQIHMQIETDQRVLAHHPINQSTLLNSGGSGYGFSMSTGQGNLDNGAGSGNLVNNQNPPDAGGIPQGVTSIVPQRVGMPAVYLLVEGYAARAGWLIDQPYVVSSGGVPVVRADREGIEFFRQACIANYGGVPVAGAVWKQRYILPTLPNQGFTVPTNPLLGVT